MNNNQA